MTTADAAAVTRCDAELAAIAARVAAGEEHDFDLVVLGQVDWEIERLMILGLPSPKRAAPRMLSHSPEAV